MRTLVIATLIILASVAAFGQQTIPEHAPFVHGGMVDVPFIIDSTGHVLSARSYAFLAIHLETPVPAGSVEYEQDVDYLVSAEYVLRSGATISRGINAAEADADGWIVLPLAKPCAPGETMTDVGLVKVCPVRTLDDSRLFACTWASSGVSPLYSGVPVERVSCGPAKRRSARP